MESKEERRGKVLIRLSLMVCIVWTLCNLGSYRSFRKDELDVFLLLIDDGRVLSKEREGDVIVMSVANGIKVPMADAMEGECSALYSNTRL